MPSISVISRTVQAQHLWKLPANRAMLEEVIRERAKEPESLAVEGHDLVIDHFYSQFPEDAIPGDPDVLLRIEYSLREKGFVRMEAGTPEFTDAEAKRMLEVLKGAFPDLVWGPWPMPQQNAGYAQG
ncbi:MAG: hypothetical protein Q7S63_00220 [bacterium]|nr:hypothetical protein [bacterium]